MSDVMLNSTFGKYRIAELVSVGGISQVYRATSGPDTPSVAVKVMRPEKQKDSYHLKAFREEFRILKRMNHPGLPAVYEIGEVKDRACFSMELINGRPLHRVCETGQTFDGLSVFYQLVDIVAFLHRDHLVHADLKLENVLLRADGTITLLDFGNAQNLEKKSWLSFLLPGAKQRVFGTPTYLAPELALGQKVSYASDVYALGVCAFILISGEPPFGATSRTERLQANVGQVAPSLRSRGAPLPSGVIGIIDRCLDKNPKGRPHSAIELLKGIGILAAKGAKFPAQTTRVTKPH